MKCKNCGFWKARATQKIVLIEGIRNKVLALYCLMCGNLMYGHVKVIK